MVNGVQYVFDPVSGVFRPAYTTDFAATVSVGAVAITGVAPISGIVQFASTQNVNVVNTPFVSVANTAPMPISGVVNTSVTTNNTDVVLAETSGINLLTSISGILQQANRLASGISGLLGSSLTDPAFVTGAVTAIVTGTWPVSVSNTVTVSVSNTAPIPVSGMAQVGNTAPIPFSGVVQANVTNTAPIAVSGIAVVNNTVTTQTTGFNTGLVVQTHPSTSTIVSTLAPSGVSPWTSITSITTGQVFAANPSRIMFFIQNIHTGVPLYVAFSANAASTGNFNCILNPSTAVGWGGTSIADDHYRGPICVSGGGWVSWEL